MPVSSQVQTTDRSRTRDLTYIALSVALLCVCTFITIPTTVPFTLQTFALCAILALLGGKRGTLAFCAYLLIGLCGLPVFSGARGGPAVLLGNTGGYLAGFLALALLYWGATKLFGKKLWVEATAMTLGLLITYLLGTLWFVQVYSANTGAIGFVGALSLCVFPFVLPDLLKIALALLLARRIAPHLKLS